MELRLTGFIVPHDLSSDAVIVIECPMELLEGEIAELQEETRTMFPNNRHIVFANGIAMKIVKPEKTQAELVSALAKLRSLLNETGDCRDEPS